MASHLVMRTSSMAFKRPIGLSLVSSRCISTSLRPTCRLKPISLQAATLQRSFRRAYSEAPTATLSPTPKPKKRFRFLRWTWRLTYLSTIGFVGWLAYTVWDGRNPNDQFEPDPTKKTLVILGKTACVHGGIHLLNMNRNWLGVGIPT